MDDHEKGELIQVLAIAVFAILTAALLSGAVVLVWRVALGYG